METSHHENTAAGDRYIPLKYSSCYPNSRQLFHHVRHSKAFVVFVGRLDDLCFHYGGKVVEEVHVVPELA